MRNAFLKRAGILTLVALGAACSEDGPLGTSQENTVVSSSELQWAYLQFDVPFGNDGQVDSYYFHAQVASSLLDAIGSGRQNEGFIALHDAIYFDSEAKQYKTSEDDDYSGEIIFRIEHLVQAQIRKRPPEIGAGRTIMPGELDVAEPSLGIDDPELFNEILDVLQLTEQPAAPDAKEGATDPIQNTE